MPVQIAIPELGDVLDERHYLACNDCLARLGKIEAILEAWRKTGYDTGEFDERIAFLRKRLEAMKRTFFPTLP